MPDKVRPTPRDWFGMSIARHIWETKYRHCDNEVVQDLTIEDSWHRVARALASVEPRDNDVWEAAFYQVLEGFRFLPGGRILAGAGVDRNLTLFNCFVMGVIDDSIEGIFDALKEGMLTMHQGGGVGYDFSTLRPSGSSAHAGAGTASGPVSFMRIWNEACHTLLSTRGARRGAMMATLRCDHPDIETFITAKQNAGTLSNFNLSVLATDAFMEAVESNDEWPLVFPAKSPPGSQLDGSVVRVVKAQALWEKIMRSAYAGAEPGILFIDRINRANNLWYKETIAATNPCGEVPLPPYGGCTLGSINLTQFVREPFTHNAHIDRIELINTVGVAVRMLDNVVDLSRFPLTSQREMAHATRRVGLGITGLADMLLMLGVDYASEAAREVSLSVTRRLCETAYHVSTRLAREKGAFPYFEEESFLAGTFVKSLPAYLRDEIAACGVRNSHLIAIAPAGTISLLAGNVSSGIEPIFAPRHERQVLDQKGRYVTHDVEDYACRLWRDTDSGTSLPPALVDATSLDPEAHLEMQAVLQPWVDNAISKTVNVPADFEFERFAQIYRRAFELGLKGCTAFRPNPITGTILSPATRLGGCCSVEREAD